MAYGRREYPGDNWEQGLHKHRIPEAETGGLHSSSRGASAESGSLHSSRGRIAAEAAAYGCLSPEQIEIAALGDPQTLPAKARLHLEHCDDCQDRVTQADKDAWDSSSRAFE